MDDDAGEILVLGAGDAAMAAGRAATSLLWTRGDRGLLVDCGPTTLMRLHQEGRSVADVDLVLLTHFHGDHTFGLPFLLLACSDALGKGPAIVGPVGVQEVCESLMRAAYPKLCEGDGWRPRSYTEVHPGGEVATEIGAAIAATPMQHRPESLGYRVAWGPRRVAFTGDTGWTESILSLAREADLLFTECTYLTGRRPHHLSWEVLASEVERTSAKRIALVHRGAQMAEAPADLPDRVVALTDGDRVTP